MKHLKVCDCCGKKSIHLHNVKKFDSFYEYLCDDCYDEWQNSKDDSWDDTNY